MSIATKLCRQNGDLPRKRREADGRQHQANSRISPPSKAAWMRCSCANDLNVFVAGNLLWYPVEGNPNIRTAPDIMIAFRRPKGHRGSYLQWKEDGIPPQVVFEIWSPGNRTRPNEPQVQFRSAAMASRNITSSIRTPGSYGAGCGKGTTWKTFPT